MAKKEFRHDRMQTFGKYHQESVILGPVSFLKVSFSGMLSPWGGQPGCWWFEAELIEFPDLQIKI